MQKVKFSTWQVEHNYGASVPIEPRGHEEDQLQNGTRSILESFEAPSLMLGMCLFQSVFHESTVHLINLTICLYLALFAVNWAKRAVGILSWEDILGEEKCFFQKSSQASSACFPFQELSTYDCRVGVFAGGEQMPSQVRVVDSISFQKCLEKRFHEILVAFELFYGRLQECARKRGVGC